MWVTFNILIQVEKGTSVIDEIDFILPIFYLLKLILWHVLEIEHAARNVLIFRITALIVKVLQQI